MTETISLNDVKEAVSAQLIHLGADEFDDGLTEKLLDILDVGFDVNKKIFIERDELNAAVSGYEHVRKASNVSQEAARELLKGIFSHLGSTLDEQEFEEHKALLGSKISKVTTH